jgi:hypothetical protein
MDVFADKFNIDVDFGVEAIIDTISGSGLPGWIIPNNYENGDDILLVSADKLSPVGAAEPKPSSSSFLTPTLHPGLTRGEAIPVSAIEGGDEISYEGSFGKIDGTITFAGNNHSTFSIQSDNGQFYQLSANDLVADGADVMIGKGSVVHRLKTANDISHKVFIVYGSFLEPEKQKNFVVLRVPSKGCNWHKQCIPAIKRLLDHWWTSPVKQHGRDRTRYWHVEGGYADTWGTALALNFDWDGKEFVRVSDNKGKTAAYSVREKAIDACNASTPAYELSAEVDPEELIWKYYKNFDLNKVDGYPNSYEDLYYESEERYSPEELKDMNVAILNGSIDPIVLVQTLERELEVWDGMHRLGLATHLKNVKTIPAYVGMQPKNAPTKKKQTYEEWFNETFDPEAMCPQCKGMRMFITGPGDNDWHNCPTCGGVGHALLPGKSLKLHTEFDRKTGSTLPYALYIEVPKSARDHLWEPVSEGQWEFWAFKSRPRALKGEKIIFTMDGLPIAEAVVGAIEAPGESACLATGKFERHHKVLWNPSTFKKYK